jgi:hypothetical protein
MNANSILLDGTMIGPYEVTDAGVSFRLLYVNGKPGVSFDLPCHAPVSMKDSIKEYFPNGSSVRIGGRLAMLESMSDGRILGIIADHIRLNVEGMES